MADPHMVVCAPRDSLDILAAIGPTVAAALALIVSVWAVIVARQSTKAAEASFSFQRALSNPRLSVLERVFPEEGTVVWVVELQNSGISQAAITAFRVFVDDQETKHQNMQSANEFWLAVFLAAGITEVGRLNGDYWRSRNVSGTSTVPVVSAVFVGARTKIASCMRRIRIECAYTGLTDEKFSLTRNLGAGQAE